jgi:hypothetical protein
MEKSGRRRLREALRRSHTAIAMIVLLYLWAIGALIAALQQAWLGLGLYVATAIAIRGAPTGGLGDGSMLHLWLAGDDLFLGVVEVTFAWILAHLVYGSGPVQTLTAWGKPFLRRSHA